MENTPNKSFEPNPAADAWDMSDVPFAGDKANAEQNNETAKPPKNVYRGMTMPYETFARLDFESDLVPNEPPIIDEKGRKVVGDGNEYGVYMTDNEQLAIDTYGNPDHNHGKTLGTVRLFGGENLTISEPSFGVIYKIDTENTDIHKPWITDYLKGHYNNGYQGEEWVSEHIPKENYEVSSITIGNDILHDKENMSNATKEEIKARYEERKHHLERLCSDIGQSLPPELRFLPKRDLVKKLKEIYGDGGTAYENQSATQK